MQTRQAFFLTLFTYLFIHFFPQKIPEPSFILKKVYKIGTPIKKPLQQQIAIS